MNPRNVRAEDARRKHKSPPDGSGGRWIKAEDQVERGASNKRGVKCSTWSASAAVSSLTKRITPVGGWNPPTQIKAPAPTYRRRPFLSTRITRIKSGAAEKKTRAISADRSWNQSIALSGRRGLQPNETHRLWAFRISVGTNLPISESMGKLKVPPLLLHR